MRKSSWTIQGSMLIVVIAALSASPAEAVEQREGAGWTLGVIGSDERTAFEDIDDLIEQPEPAGDVTPMLIDDPAAWAACFGPTLNPSHALASWGAVAPSDLTISLTCGPSDTKTFGWHHIQTSHQAQWQTRVDQIVAIGGPNIAWDDYMAEATGFAMGGRYTAAYDGKRCYTDLLGVYAPGESTPRLTFSPSVVASMTNSVVITSVPTSNEDCSRRAPFAV